MDIKFKLELKEPVKNVGGQDLTEIGFTSFKLKHSDIQLELEKIKTELEPDFNEVYEAVMKEQLAGETAEEAPQKPSKKGKKKDDDKELSTEETYQFRIQFLAFLYYLAMQKTKDKTIITRLGKLFERVVKYQYEEEDSAMTHIILFNGGTINQATFMDNENISNNLSIDDWRHILSYFLQLLA
jgi:hypothetical protein